MEGVSPTPDGTPGGFRTLNAQETAVLVTEPQNNRRRRSSTPLQLLKREDISVYCLFILTKRNFSANNLV
jgi:hypothetical protein